MEASINQLDNKDGHDRLIGGNKIYYAARAWQGYLNCDCERGAIIVKMSEVEEVRGSPGFYKVPIQYAPAGGNQLAKLGLWPDERMAKVLQNYNPEEEVVFVFVHINGASSTYTWKTPIDITPPKAYEQYRRGEPFGLRLDPNRTHLEILKLLVNYEFEQRSQQKELERKILSDSSEQAGFIKSLIDGQQDLRMELEASGIGIDKNGQAYILEQEDKKPGTEFERFKDQARIIDYLAVTTAVNRMAQVYEQRKASSENWLGEVAQAGLETLDDKRTVIMAACMTLDWGPEPDIQVLFLLHMVARIRARLKKFPRIEGILKAEGGNPEDVFLEKLLWAVPLAWSRYEQEPHLPSKNDSLNFIRYVEDEILADETIEGHHQRIFLERLKENGQYNPADQNTELTLNSLFDASRSELVDNLADSLSLEEEFFTREQIRQDREILMNVLSPREKELVTLMIEDEDATDADRGEKMNITEGAIWKMKNRIKDKARRAKRRLLSRFK